MERLTQVDRACALAAAAMTHELNSEFTVILSSVTEAMVILEAGHPARPLLSDLEGAAQRCAQKCAVLQAFNARHGVRPGRARFAALTLM